MATFINGVSDYVTQTHPTQSNLAFDQQALQTKEAAYLAGHKKVNDLYGSLLNSDMTRSENIAARDEFFKLINNDIRRMGGLDFSLDTNVSAASRVFESIYTNKNLVKDMVWTKKLNEAKAHGEALKNCIDPEKCGGQWWEKGDKYLAYKQEEFKNASNSEAMNFGDVSYIPFTNTMAKAMKIAKEANLEITHDYILGNGYKVTKKNGGEVLSPLTALLAETLGNDPGITDMFKAESYVDRKDWIYDKLNTGEFADEEQAHVGYFKMRSDEINRQIREANDGVDLDVDMLRERLEELSEKNLQPGTVYYNEYQEKQAMLQKAMVAQQHLQRYNLAQANIHDQVAMRTLADSLDENDAAIRLNSTINQAAEILSHKGEEIKTELDKKAELALQHQYRVSEEAIEFQHSKELVEHKAKYGVYDGKDGKDDSEVTSTEVTTYNTAVNEVKKLENPTEAEMRKHAGLSADSTKELTAEQKASFKKANAAKLKVAKEKANTAAIKAGKMPDYYDHVNVALWQHDMNDKQRGTFLAKLIKDGKAPKGTTSDQLWKAIQMEKDGTINIYDAF
jgi:hypothetical protein